VSFDPTRKRPLQPARAVMPVLPAFAQPDDPRRLGDAVCFQEWLTKKRLAETPTPRVLVLSTVRKMHQEAAAFAGDRRFRITDQGDRLRFQLKVTRTA